ncbi:hypothetical protein HGG71_12050, partial [Rhodobacteraceae bacterium R_SAG2]|nr:hypothetical protein [Rhodobacteraceae bacterium R_SAG2]
MREGIISLALGLFFALGAWTVRAAPEGETWAGALPLGAALALMLVGGLMVRGAVAGRMTEPPAQPERDAILRVTALAVLAVLYQQAIGLFGYDLPTAAAAPAALWLFGVRRLLPLCIAAVLCPLVLHVLF